MRNAGGIEQLPCLGQRDVGAFAVVVLTQFAIDVPSGLDCDTGRPSPVAVRADFTITFVAPKVGFVHAAEYTGRVLIADIGAPSRLLDLP